MTAPQDRYSTLDGIRGIAAFAVVLFHCGLICDAPWMAGHGALAVDVFFVMSGFVVDRAYGARLRSGWPVAAFAAARFVRLYPLYLVGVLLGLVVRCIDLGWKGMPAAAGWPMIAAVDGALLIPRFLSGEQQVFPLDGPSWSLLVEVVMNVGFAAVARRLRPMHLGAIVGAAAIVLILAALGGTPLLRGGRSATLWVDFARGAFGFGVGLLISGAERRGRLDILREWPTPLVAIALLSALLVPRGPADAWLDPLAILVLCPAIVTLAVSRKAPSERVRRACARAGALSYPLYILHAPILDLASDLTRPGTPDLGSPRALVLSGAACLCLALAVAVSRWLEPALVRAARRWIVRDGPSAIRGPSIAVAADGPD